MHWPTAMSFFAINQTQHYIQNGLADQHFWAAPKVKLLQNDCPKEDFTTKTPFIVASGPVILQWNSIGDCSKTGLGVRETARGVQNLASTGGQLRIQQMLFVQEMVYLLAKRCADDGWNLR